MSNVESFNSKLPEWQAIPLEKVLIPVMPVLNFIQEAEDLEGWGRKDLAELAAAGITEAHFDDLKTRFEGCREAQSRWRKERQAELEWTTRAPEAFELRDDLLRSFRFAFRKNENLLGIVSQIAEGAGNDDMIQDLNDLSVLGMDHLDLLAGIGFDAQKLEAVASTSAEMGNILAAANGARQGNNEAKDLRDRAYTHLKELVDDIRAAGKYVFWKNPKRMKGYTSGYLRRKNKKTNAPAEASE